MIPKEYSKIINRGRKTVQLTKEKDQIQKHYTEN